VYRLYNPNSGDHHYTVSTTEKDHLVSLGWKYEGVGWNSADGTTIPLYREFNPNATTGTHNYTTSQVENQKVISDGWNAEGVGWYAIGNSDAAQAQAATETAAQQTAQAAAKKQWIADHPEKASMIASVPSKDSIEADVVLNGSGTGSHAKLVICTSTSAVSFGLQYDSCAVAPYTGKTMALIENINSNSAGGQSYVRPGNKEVSLGQSYHLMMTINDDGSGSVYLNNQLIGTYSNPSLAGQTLYLRVEASGRVNGDQVSATFSNIKLKYGGIYQERAYSIYEFKSNPTINYTASTWDNIQFSGYLSGLGAGDNWDNKYDSVSDIIQFVQ